MAERVQGEVVSVGNKNIKDETLAPVISNAATVKKTTGLKKLWRGFFAEDIKTVKHDVLKTVIEPSIKSGILNAITSAATLLLFGKNGYNNGSIFRPNLLSGGVAYNNITRLQNGHVVANGTSKISLVNNSNLGHYTAAEVYDPEYIRYASYQDAVNVYETLCERISKYTVATVKLNMDDKINTEGKNLYDVSGQSGYDVVLQNWGWYGIEWYRILPVGDGTWILKLPQPTPLNGPTRS